jgi:hypothetical protein
VKAIFSTTKRVAQMLKLEQTDERLTRRTGLILINRFGDKINLSQKINRAFREPGSNRGIQASEYVLSIAEMLIDGATCLEDIRLFENDEAYKEMAEVKHYPTSDAIGDWLRRHGGADGEKRLWNVLSPIIQSGMTGGSSSGLTLDIDGTLIEADKGDAKFTYKGFRGYHPLVGGSLELGLFVGSRFQQGNVSPQADLVSFIDEECLKNMPGTFTTIRSDSAGYNSEVINYCFDNNLRFTITADHDCAVMESVSKIPESEWDRGINDDGSTASYQVAETVHSLEKTTRSFRMVVKRIKDTRQQDLFTGQYRYWIIATNIPQREKDGQAIIHFQNQRGEFEKMIGELKHHYGLDHFPCGQFEANCLYFTIGILAFTLVQLLKRYYFGSEWKKKSVRSLRYHWLHVPSRIVSHARYTIVKVAMAPLLFQQLLSIYLQICLAPAFSSA